MHRCHIVNDGSADSVIRKQICPRNSIQGHAVGYESDHTTLAVGGLSASARSGVQQQPTSRRSLQILLPDAVPTCNGVLDSSERFKGVYVSTARWRGANYFRSFCGGGLSAASDCDPFPA
jgi:hypothetical protein